MGGRFNYERPPFDHAETDLEGNYKWTEERLLRRLGEIARALDNGWHSPRQIEEWNRESNHLAFEYMERGKEQIRYSLDDTQPIPIIRLNEADDGTLAE